MSNILNHKLNRRSLMSGTAKAALVAGLAGISSGNGLALANAENFAFDDEWSPANVNRFLCNHIHARKAKELTKLLHSPYLNIDEKEHAIANSQCPRCDAKILPLGVVI